MVPELIEVSVGEVVELVPDVELPEVVVVVGVVGIDDGVVVLITDAGSI